MSKPCPSLHELARIEALPAAPWETVYGQFEETSGGLLVREEACLMLALSTPGATALRVSAKFTTADGAAPRLDSSGYVFLAGQARGVTVGLGDVRGPAVKISMNEWPVGVAAHAGFAPGSRHSLVYARADGRLHMTLDGDPVLDLPDPRSGERLRDLLLYLPAGLVLHAAQAAADTGPAHTPQPSPRAGRYDLYACFDFYDDLVRAPWTERTFRDAMRIYRAHRVRRLYFIDHFGVRGGWWDERPPGCGPSPELNRNIRSTHEHVGEFLEAAARAAHAEGLELYAVLKPYESALYGTLPPGSDEARRYGKLPRLGGPQYCSPHFVTRHPDWRLARDMTQVPADLLTRGIGSLVLRAGAGAAGQLDPQRLQLWTSPDNTCYRRYDGPRRVCLADGLLRFEGLEIAEPFVAIETQGGATHRFGNVLRDLLDVRDRRGERLPVSYAFLERSVHHGGDWRKTGFAMDIPGNLIGAMDDFLWIDGGHPLAFGLGLVETLPGALCEAYPEVRTWWLEQVEACVRAGADGVDLRIGSHNRTFDWEAYGFNPPVVAAFRERHGVDILREPFDRVALRKLRGAFYTEFVREASRRLRAAGKGVQAHVNALMRSPDWHTWKETDFDWRSWIAEGLLDAVTIMQQELRVAPGVLAAEAARAAGVKVNFRPYLNAFPRLASGPQRLAHLVREAREGGADGVILYENAAYLAAAPDGSATVTCPWILDGFREHARPL